MRNHGSSDEQAGDAGITTEDIAHPASVSDTGTDYDGLTAPVYPGEATTEEAAEEPRETRERPARAVTNSRRIAARKPERRTRAQTSRCWTRGHRGVPQGME